MEECKWVAMKIVQGRKEGMIIPYPTKYTRVGATITHIPTENLK